MVHHIVTVSYTHLDVYKRQHMVPKAELEFLPQMLEKVYVYCIELKDFSGKRRKEI